MSYDPTIGRWTAEDPIAFKGGDANLYRYVGNAPTDATDPTGEYESFWADYWHYLTHPGDQDTDIQIGQGVAVGVAVVAGGGACYFAVAGGSAVGSITITEYAGSTHFVAGVEGQFYHALGRQGAIRLMGASSWEVPTQTFWNTVTIPLRNPANAIAVGESGAATTNCLTGAIKVIGAGL